MILSGYMPNAFQKFIQRFGTSREARSGQSRQQDLSNIQPQASSSNAESDDLQTRLKSYRSLPSLQTGRSVRSRSSFFNPTGSKNKDYSKHEVKKLLEEGESAGERIEDYLKRSANPERVQNVDSRQIADELNRLQDRIRRIEAAGNTKSKLEKNLKRIDAAFGIPSQDSSKRSKTLNKAQFEKPLQDPYTDATLRADNLYRTARNVYQATGNTEFKISALASAAGIESEKLTNFANLVEKKDFAVDYTAEHARYLSASGLAPLTEDSGLLKSEVNQYRNSITERPTGIDRFRQPHIDEIEALTNEIYNHDDKLGAAIEARNAQSTSSAGTVNATEQATSKSDFEFARLRYSGQSEEWVQRSPKTGISTGGSGPDLASASGRALQSLKDAGQLDAAARLNQGTVVRPGSPKFG
jgi:hypothetical protein